MSAMAVKAEEVSCRRWLLAHAVDDLYVEQLDELGSP